MLRSKTPIILFIILLLFVTVVAAPACSAQTGAVTAISSAKNTLLTCYNAAKEAEAAGVNITVLTATLNEAGLLLSQAEAAYAASDFDAAFNLATQSQNRLSNLVGEANALKETATQQRDQDFLVNVVGSVIGTFAVIVAGSLAWLFLKRKYKTTEVDASESPRV
jgi:hypothetical protein